MSTASDGGSPTIRPATPADIPAIRAILAAHDHDGPVIEGGTDIIGGYLAYLVASQTVLAAEDDRRLVGFGAVVDAGIAVQLADLFVHPDRIGAGIGKRLLAALFGDAVNRTTFASADPRALPLYVRAGMTPLWVSLYLEGDPKRLPDDPTLTTWDGTPEELAEIELAWSGVDRRRDHAYWASQPAADPFLVEDAEGPVAIGYGRAKQASTARALTRLLVRPGADPGAALAGLVRAGRGGRVQACVLGPNPVLPVLLEHGFHVVDSDQFLASAADLVDPARLLPDSGML
jgi:GNAT superfamily N-acetyltransferase